MTLTIQYNITVQNNFYEVVYRANKGSYTSLTPVFASFSGIRHGLSRCQSSAGFELSSIIDFALATNFCRLGLEVNSEDQINVMEVKDIINLSLLSKGQD
jgi:hypothetical protein